MWCRHIDGKLHYSDIYSGGSSNSVGGSRCGGRDSKSDKGDFCDCN